MSTKNLYFLIKNVFSIEIFQKKTLQTMEINPIWLILDYLSYRKSNIQCLGYFWNENLQKSRTDKNSVPHFPENSQNSFHLRLILSIRLIFNRVFEFAHVSSILFDHFWPFLTNFPSRGVYHLKPRWTIIWKFHDRLELFWVLMKLRLENLSFDPTYT